LPAAESGRILAIDYGEKRLGVAVSDPSRRVAYPSTVIERSGMKRDIERLAALIEESEVVRIVVGNPRTMGGREGPQAALVKSFIVELQRVFSLPIETYDERLSSKEARASLAAAGIGGRKAKGKIDKVAAALFLQSYLDRQARRAR
jgi:putative Holliday junction resolvase